MRYLWSIALLTGVLPAMRAAICDDSLFTAGFGLVRLYEPTAAPTEVVLFISGDGGWKHEVADMAKLLREQGALVAGVDIRAYFRGVRSAAEKCFYPAGDFEELSKAVQQRAHLPAYQTPLLAGISSGATLVYALLAEAPHGTFRGGISLGFCPELEIEKEPCRGNSLHCYRVGAPAPAWKLQPDAAIQTPWYVLQGTNDQCCALEKAQAFVEQIPGAKLVQLPGVGHGFSVRKNWVTQFRASFLQLRARPEKANDSGVRVARPAAFMAAAASGGPAPEALSDLPLIFTPPSPTAVSDRLVVLLSGDGGWKDFDQGIADGLAAQGMPVVGLNTLQYFWSERSPESAAWDLTRIMQVYTRQYGKKSVVLAGYSFGAEVLPFLYNRLNDREKALVHGMALLSPGDKADFAFHFSAWLNRSSAQARPLAPELEKMNRCRTLFLFGSEEDTAWVRVLIGERFSLKVLKGGHHYGGNTQALSALIAAQ